MDLKLSPEEVAQLLHLAPRQIVALENDDYANLPQPTYVRGYLRNYALLLGLAPEAILDAYARLELVLPRPAKTAAPGPGRDQQIRFAGYVVVAVIMAFVFAWWQGRQVPAPARHVSGPPQVDMSTPASPGPPRANEAGRAAPELSAAPPAVPAAPAPTPVPRSPTASAVPPGAAAPGQLVLQMQQDSWAEVYDAAGRKLLYEMVPAGRTVRLDGAPPLSVFLGNVDGVLVDYDGKSVDAKRYRRGMVARFSVGADNTTKP